MRKVFQILGFIIPVIICIVFPSFIIGLLSSYMNFILFFIAWGIWILVAQKVFEFAYLDWIVPVAFLVGRFIVWLIY